MQRLQDGDLALRGAAGALRGFERPVERPRRPGVRRRLAYKVCSILQILQFFGGLVLGCIKTKVCKKYAFDSIFQALQDLHTFAPLQSQKFSKKSV